MHARAGTDVEHMHKSLLNYADVQRPAMVSCRVPALAAGAATRRRISEQLETAETAGGAFAERAAAIRASAGTVYIAHCNARWAASHLLSLAWLCRLRCCVCASFCAQACVATC